MAFCRPDRPPDMSISIVGLGPAGLEHLPARSAALLETADTVILRTARHPAAAEIANRRDVVSCDDLYESLDEFADIYAAISDRVFEAAEVGSVVYAIPGSAVVGEMAVAKIRSRAKESGIELDVLAGTSFLDLVYLTVDLDPIADGCQILDARDLPSPLPLHVPTIITQADSSLRCADVSVALARTVDSDTVVTVLDRLGDSDQIVETMTVSELGRYDGGPRTTVFVPAMMSGLLGLIATNRILREECPWDRKQTHHTLLTYLIEEAYETADAIGQLPADAPAGEPDFGAYAEVEDELGDLLLQVIFHATLASETGAFDIDEVAENTRRKLVRRHPHVFGDVDVRDADDVLANWEQIKSVEKGRDSLMDDVPSSMPGITRAMKVQKRARSVGFDFENPQQAVSDLRGEIDELLAAEGDLGAVTDELGDVLFSAVNLSRQLGVDPETALRASVDKFVSRFRHMERHFKEKSVSLSDATRPQMEEAWEVAKEAERHGKT